MSTGSTMTSRVHRKVLRIPSKRHPGKGLPGKLHSMSRVSIYNFLFYYLTNALIGFIHQLSNGKLHPGKKINSLRTVPVCCDNSNDSGLGYETHSSDVPIQSTAVTGGGAGMPFSNSSAMMRPVPTSR